MGRVQDMVDSVLAEGQIEVEPSVVLRALDSRHKQMVRRARCFRKTIALGSTVADQAAYTLPDDVIEILEVQVDGIPYGNARHVDFAQGARGYVTLSDDGGVVARDDSALGARQIGLYPKPTESGGEIVVYAVCAPPDLAADDDTTLKVPADYDEKLEAGAIARLLRRLEHRPDLAAPHEQEFADACEELRVQTNRSFRGPGPARVRVVGINA